ncbi:MAG: GntR family transcriptional regulator, partial [Candidatus Nanopelagicales bacterium]
MGLDPHGIGRRGLRRRRDHRHLRRGCHAMTYEPLPQQSTAEMVATRIRDAVLDGTLRPGDRLIEADIAAELGVSRGPVR